VINPVVIPVLTLREVVDLRERLKEVRWYDGAETAGPIASQVKHNLQARDEDTEGMRQTIVGKLLNNPQFNSIVRPKSIALMFSRYQIGDFYGVHVDAAQVGRAHTAIRRDVSFTISLTALDTYQGGDLVIESSLDERAFRIDAGEMIIYPSTSLHRVEPVTDGERLVIVGWVRSLIRDPAHRELLYELDAARASLFGQFGKTPETDLLARCAANLVREWMED